MSSSSISVLHAPPTRPHGASFNLSLPSAPSIDLRLEPSFCSHIDCPWRQHQARVLSVNCPGKRPRSSYDTCSTLSELPNEPRTHRLWVPTCLHIANLLQGIPNLASLTAPKSRCRLTARLLPTTTTDQGEATTTAKGFASRHRPEQRKDYYSSFPATGARSRPVFDILHPDIRHYLALLNRQLLCLSNPCPPNPNCEHFRLLFNNLVFRYQHLTTLIDHYSYG